MSEKTKGAKKAWERYKYVAVVALAGVLLLAWPAGKDEALAQQPVSCAEAESLSRQMEQILSSVSGVGQVKVLLTMDTDGERQLAQDTELSYSGAVAAPEDYTRVSSTVLTDGDVGEASVVVKTVYPTYRGALVVCTGGDRPEVQLTVIQAVAALTGLSSDRISVAKWQ